MFPVNFKISYLKTSKKSLRIYFSINGEFIMKFPWEFRKKLLEELLKGPLQVFFPVNGLIEKLPKNILNCEFTSKIIYMGVCLSCLGAAVQFQMALSCVQVKLYTSKLLRLYL